MRSWHQFLETKLEESLFDETDSVVVSPDEFGGFTVDHYINKKRSIIFRTKDHNEAVEVALKTGANFGCNVFDGASGPPQLIQKSPKFTLD